MHDFTFLLSIKTFEIVSIIISQILLFLSLYMVFDNFESFRKLQKKQKYSYRVWALALFITFIFSWIFSSIDHGQEGDNIIIYTTLYYQLFIGLMSISLQYIIDTDCEDHSIVHLIAKWGIINAAMLVIALVLANYAPKAATITMTLPYFLLYFPNAIKRHIQMRKIIAEEKGKEIREITILKMIERSMFLLLTLQFVGTILGLIFSINFVFLASTICISLIILITIYLKNYFTRITFK